jgi:hypothetical protein
MCTRIENPQVFIYSYGIMFGIGKGMMFSTALQSAISHLPSKKGLVSGVVNCAFGFGGFFFGLIQKQLCNPNNFDPQIIRTWYGTEELMFDENVASRVPYMLRSMNLLWMSLFTFGVLTITRRDDLNTAEKVSEDFQLSKE